MPAALSLVTVCARVDLARALVLAHSFKSHHPESTVRLVVADADRVDHAPEDWLELIPGVELAGDQYGLLAASFAPAELARVLVPTALAGITTPALALAPDAEVLAPIEPPKAALAVVATGDPDAGVCDDGALFADGARAAATLERLAELAAQHGDDGLLTRGLTLFDDIDLVHEATWAVTSGNVEERGCVEQTGSLVNSAGASVGWVRRSDGTALPGQADYEAAVAAAVIPHSDPVPSALADGTPLDGRLRRLFAAGVSEGELTVPPFDPEGTRRFVAYLEGPSAGGVSRYLHDVWESRPDLRATYPDLGESADRRGFLGWTAAHGAAELGIPGWLLPTGDLESAPPAGETPPLGVNVAGYFQSELGVGEAARRVVAALDAAQVPLLPVQTATIPPTRRGKTFGVAASAAPFDFNLVCVNADGLPAFAEEVGERFFRGRHTIGSWWWELPTFPERYRGAFDHIDEVWVGSQYVFEAISPVAPIPVPEDAGRGHAPDRHSAYSGGARSARRVPRALRVRLQLGARAEEPHWAHRGVHKGFLR